MWSSDRKPIAGGIVLRRARFRVPIPDRILIHLLDYVREGCRAEYPRETTQGGIAEILGTRRSHVSISLSALEERGYVEDKLCRVENEARRRKVYSLTYKGYAHAKELKERLLKKKVGVPKDGMLLATRIEEIGGCLGECHPLVRILGCITEEGVLDTGALKGVSDPKKEVVLGTVHDEVPEGVMVAENDRVKERRGTNLILVGGITAFCSVAVAQWEFFGSPNPESMFMLLGVLWSMVMLTVLSRTSLKRYSKEIPVLLGVFLLSLGFFLASMPTGMSWASHLFPYLIVTGIPCLLLAHNIGGFSRFTPQAFCTGLGLPIAISAISWIVYLSDSSQYVGVFAALLWLFLGTFLARVRFLPEHESEKVVKTLKSTIPFSFGLFLIILGLSLLIAYQYTEGIAPIVLGAPLMIYGVDSSVGLPMASRIASCTFASTVVLTTLYTVLFG